MPLKSISHSDSHCLLQMLFVSCLHSCNCLLTLPCRLQAYPLPAHSHTAAKVIFLKPKLDHVTYCSHWVTPKECRTKPHPQQAPWAPETWTPVCTIPTVCSPCFLLHTPTHPLLTTSQNTFLSPLLIRWIPTYPSKPKSQALFPDHPPLSP